MKTVNVSIAVFLVLVFGALWYLEYTENPRSNFATFADMEAAGMIASGWLPDFLPRSAREIEVTTGIDTNRVKASFKYDVGDVHSVEAACKKVSNDNRASKYVCQTRNAETATLLLGHDGVAFYSRPAASSNPAVEQDYGPAALRLIR